MKMSKLTRDLGQFINKRSPEILTGFGIAGMILTTIIAIKDTPKALQLIEKLRSHGIQMSLSEEALADRTDKLTGKTFVISGTFLLM